MAKAGKTVKEKSHKKYKEMMRGKNKESQSHFTSEGSRSTWINGKILIYYA